MTPNPSSRVATAELNHSLPSRYAFPALLGNTAGLLTILPITRWNQTQKERGEVDLA